MSKYVDSINFITEECCNCGMPFAMTEDFHDRRRKDHVSFYCPKGHKQYYSGKSNEQKLRAQLKENERLLNLESAGRQKAVEQRDRATKSYMKIRDRVKNGVCPCCTRTFQNLLQHMKNEHPNFGLHETLKTLRVSFGLTQADVAREAGINSTYISLYERERPVPEYAKSEILGWIESFA